MYVCPKNGFPPLSRDSTISATYMEMPGFRHTILEIVTFNLTHYITLSFMVELLSVGVGIGRAPGRGGY